MQQNRKSQAPSLAESRDIADNLMRRKRSSSGIEWCIYNETLLYLFFVKNEGGSNLSVKSWYSETFMSTETKSIKRKTRPVVDGTR